MLEGPPVVCQSRLVYLLVLTPRFDAEKRQVLRSTDFVTLNLDSIAEVFVVQFSRRNSVIPIRQWELCCNIRCMLVSLLQEWRQRRLVILELCNLPSSFVAPPCATVKRWLCERLIGVDRAAARELKRIRVLEKDMLDGESLDLGWVFEQELEPIMAEDEAKLEQAKAETAYSSD